MEFKQSEQKYTENIDAVVKKLLPAVLAVTRYNGQLVVGWLMKNCVEAEGEIVDASVENITKAIRALDIAGLVEWKTPPKVVPTKKRPDFLQTSEGSAVNHARENRVSELDIQMEHEKKRRAALGDAANREILEEAAALVSNHSSVSHSRSYRERAELKKEFEKLVASRVHPKDLLAALKAKQETFANGDVTRPTFGRQ
jgi:hypothetical protein